MSHLYKVIVDGIDYRRRIAALTYGDAVKTMYAEQLKQAEDAERIGDSDALHYIIFWLNMNWVMNHVVEYLFIEGLRTSNALV